MYPPAPLRCSSCGCIRHNHDCIECDCEAGTMRLHIRIAVGVLLIELGSDDEAEEASPDLASDTIHVGYVDPAMDSTHIPSVTYDE